MRELLRTPQFQTWLNGLKDPQAYARIETRLYRLALGNPGDSRLLRHGVSEMRIDYGPGYRIYYTQRGNTVFFILGGGDKTTQAKDIKAALELALRA
jgi:putative addiction module killer protein